MSGSVRIESANSIPGERTNKSAEPHSVGVGFRILFWEVTECSTPVSEGGFVLKSVCQHKTKGGNRLNFTYTNLDELPLTLKASEAAAVLRISKSKVYELARTESFPAIRIGTRVVIPRDKLIQWMNDQAEGLE